MADGNAAGDYYDAQGESEESARDERMEELARVVQQAIDDNSVDDSDSSKFRENASNAYYGRKYGDEVEGRSQVVSRDVLETIEWVLAQLLRIFTGDKFCEFTPTGPEDVEAAKQQTDYVNHVLMQDCNGTVLFYDWFKEALLHRKGIVHWGYLDTTCPKIETYTGLSQEQLSALLTDAAVEAVELSERQEMTPEGPALAFDVRLKRLVTERKLKVEAIAPEDFIIDDGARSIDDATVTGHKSRKTRSDLRSEGVPDTVIDRLNVDKVDDGEAQARDVNKNDTGNANELGDGQERFDLYTLYVKHDLDGDGYAELLRVRYVGDEIVETEPAMEAPYADVCPLRTPHRFEGLSLSDVVMDIQRIKTVLWRQALDNIYAANRPQREVNIAKVPNPADLLKVELGANIRVTETGAVRDLTVPLATDSTLAMIGYIDQVREERTGTSAASQGRDADQIHDTAKGMAMAVSQAQMRIELIARLFAEGGVKRLFMGLYNAIVRNQDAPRMVRLRGKFVSIDPREWRERNDVSVTVGLGTGTREAQIGTLQMIATMQQNLLTAGVPIVTVDKLKHTLTKLVEAAGFRDAGSFLAEPQEVPPPAAPPKSDAVTIAEMQIKLEQVKLADDQAKQQAQFQLDIAKLRSSDMEKARQHELEMARLGATSRLDAAKLAQDDRQFYDQLLHEATLKRQELQQSAEQARHESEADEEAMKSKGPADKPSAPP